MIRGWIAALAALLGCAGAQAAELAGRPPVSLLRAELPVYPQNFDVAQDGQGQIYVANSQGVMCFDGERWALIELPNHDLARSLAYDGAERVYVGGFDAFGYIERDATGAERFHDLTPRFRDLLGDEPFADVWDLHLAPQGVFFRALKHVFLFEPGSGRVALWRHEGRFGGITQLGPDVVLQFRGQGLKRLVGDGWALLPGSEPLQQLAYQLIARPDGSLLTLEADGQWREYRDGAVRPRAMPPDFPPASSFARALALPDGTLALATDEGELFLLDPERGMTRSFRIGAGSLGGLVRALDGGLLTAGSEGVYHVAWPTAWTLVGGADVGLTASVTRVARWGERWLALTGSGVFEVEQPGGLQQRFRATDWTGHEAWDLLALDESRALLAESYAVKLIENGRAREITPRTVYPRLFLHSAYHPDRIYVGTEAGLALLRHGPGEAWSVALREGDTPDALMATLVETGPDEIWAGTDRLGVARMRLSPDGTRVLQVTTFGPAEGLHYGRIAGASLAALDGELLATTEAGIFRWNGKRFERTALDGLGPQLARDEWISLEAGPAGERWAWSYNRAWRKARGGPWTRQELGSFLPGPLQELSFDGSGAALFAAGKAILRFEPQPATIAARPPRVRLRGVERLHPSGGREALPIDGSGPPQLREGQGVSFWFALPEYRRSEAARYQVRLAGLSTQYSEWSAASSFSYLHLQPGRYEMHVRARDAAGAISELPPFAFSVQPRWYRAGWARALGLLAAAGTVALLVVLTARLRTRRLVADKERLQRMVAERTRDLESANRQLEAMAHLDGLLEIPNRRRLDDYLDQVWTQCADHHRPMSVLVIDVDRFKDYNDTHGHLAGDEVLKELAQKLSSCLRRAEDLVARYGGDEFVAVLPGAELDVAMQIAEAMRRAVEDSDIGSTISVGAAMRRPRAGQSVAELLDAADGALYEAKRNGRNRAVSAPPL